MDIFASQVWFRSLTFLFTLVLFVPAALSQAKSTGAAGFTEIVVPTEGDPDALAAADVNHDGAMDIIAANPDHGTVSVLLGDGSGHFHHASGSPFPAGHLPSDMAILTSESPTTRFQMSLCLG